MHSVAGLGGFSVANSVRQNNEITIAVQKLSGTEQFTGEFRPQKTSSRASGPMQDQHSICGLSLRIARQFSPRPDVQAQLRKLFTRFEFEIVRDIVTFGRRVFRWFLCP